MSTVVAAKDLPLHIGKPDEFRRSQEFFQRVDFNDSNVCRALSLSSICDFGTVKWEAISLESIPASLRWCINIFMRGLPASERESRAICGDEAFNSLSSLGLLRPGKKDPAVVVSPVWLYPCDNFVIASDRISDPDGEAFQPGEDVVFPAIYPGTIRFLKLLPDARNGEVLDLCGGSGIGALRLSRTARTAFTADVAERSAMFADFNGRLNGVQVGSVCGDLYEPVGDRQFDLISAHPPFVPAVGPNMVYRDGGDTGEVVTQRIISGLPEHLRAGGTCVVLCVARDTEEKNFELRVRDWLGEKSGGFDIVFGCEKILTVEEVVDSLRRGGRSPGSFDAKQIAERLRSFATRQFVYGALFIRRLSAGLAGEPLRLQLTPSGTAADFERVLAWRERGRQPDFVRQLADSRPHLAENLELTIRHVMQKGELVPAQFTFSVESGFQAALRPDGWVVPLVARLDGQKTVREIFEQSRSADELPKGFPLEAFIGLVRQMIEHGFLKSDARMNGC